jgi:serine/threonine-protein kinase
MSIPTNYGEFQALVVKSGLLDEATCRSLARQYGWTEKTSALDAARGFIAAKKLTIFQAKQLLKGRWRGLAFDGYRLLYPLGSGGMGYVYAAEEEKTGWQVAIKVLSDHYRKDIAMLTRIQLEAQAGMRLKHPNILRTLSINRLEDTHGALYYVVMELVKGVSLNELVALNKKLPVWRACDIVRQAALGLHYAHQQGLIHRDVKPDNLLIRSDGSVKVLDFGLAMIDEHDEEFTMAMIMGQDRLGTADYVAPEQSINSYRVDHRVDIYGLGGTLFFALTGRPPVTGRTNAEKIRAHREHRIDPPHRIREDIPEELSKIVLKMLAKWPEKRYATAAQVAEVLSPYARREPVEFDFPRIVRARAKWAKKREELRKQRLRDESTTRAPSAEPRKSPEQAAAEPSPPFGATSGGSSVVPPDILEAETRVAPPGSQPE